MASLVRSLLVVAAATAALAAPAVAEPPAPAPAGPPPTVDLTVAVKPAHGGRDPAIDAWVRARLRGLVQAVIDSCYRPALATRPALAGTLTVRLRLDRRLAIAGVKADRDRFRLPSFAACVVGAVRAHEPPPPDRTAPPPAPPVGAIVDEQPPPAKQLPLAVTLTFRVAPPAAGAPPVTGPRPAPPAPPVCGASPAGCKRTGCAAGFVCDVHARCMPSTCTCDAATGRWSCTEDCGGGVCVRAPSDQPHAPENTAPR